MKFWSLSQLPDTEKNDILSKHREVYNGYQTMQPEVKNTHPLYVQDFAKDKLGVTMKNDGTIKPYTDYRINESHVMDTCEQCGGKLTEGECSECGYRMEEDFKSDSEIGDEEMHTSDEVPSFDTDGNFLGMAKPHGDMEELGEFDLSSIFGKKKDKDEKDKKDKKSYFSSTWWGHGNDESDDSDSDTDSDVDTDTDWDIDIDLDESKTGKLSDIYNVEDLGDDDFDYVEGGGNDYGTFEKMHHMKKIKSESTATSNAPLSYGKHYNQIDEPYDFVSNGPIGDGGTLRQKSVNEVGFTGGGNAPDFDAEYENPAYDFKSDGPIEDTYTKPADDMDLDQDDIKKPYDFESGGPDNGGEAYPMFEDECEECWEKMESAWSEEKEIDEVDISGAQGSQENAEKPYAFVSTGPGKAGPYQTHSWGGEKLGGYEGENEDVYWELEKDEVDPDKIDRDASWEEITSMVGDDEFSNLDEETKEKLILQREKIVEMFERFKKFN